MEIKELLNRDMGSVVEWLIDNESKFVLTPLKEKTADGSKVPCGVGLSDADDYAYKDIAEFEEIVDYKVNATFRAGWRMARTTNKQLGISAKEEEGR